MPILNWSKRLLGSRRNLSATLSTVVLAGSAFTIVIAFQNCGKAGFDSSSQNSSLYTANPSDSAPFAYESSIDMITYNSCSSPTSQGQTFTFKAGSYDSKSSTTGTVGASTVVAKSGVRIRQDFINYAYSVLKPDYPNTDIVASQVRQLLGDSKLNSGVIPQMSVRSIFKSSRLNNVYGKTNTPSIGIDILPQLGDLVNPTWADLLVAASFPKKSKIEYTNFFPGAANAQSRIEGEFHFNTNEQTAEEYRNAFNKAGGLDAQLVLGFSYAGEGWLVTPNNPEDEIMTAAYGRGYQMTFSQMPYGTVPAGDPIFSYRPNNVVTKVEEYNLEDNKQVTDATWDCSLKLRIVRQEDAHFDWSTVVTSVDLAVTADSNIPADLKAAKKQTITDEIASYYQRPSGALQAGFCPKMDYDILGAIPPQTTDSVYSVGAWAGKSYAQILEMIRRHLPASDWDVNPYAGCVVPKKFSCYQDTPRKATEGGTYYGKFRVANHTMGACFHPFATGYSKAGQKDVRGQEPLDWCNEFVTICVKR